MKTAPLVPTVAFSFAFFTRLRLRVLALGAAVLLLSVGVQAQVVDTAAVQRQVDSLIQESRTLTDKRKYDKALEVNAAAEKLALERLGRESAAYGSCCFNRGRVNHFRHDYQEAEKWYLESKSIREEALGREHLDYAWSLNNLGNLYQNMGTYNKAEPLLLEAKDIREKSLGKEHPHYAASLNNLGVLYKNMGAYNKAEPLYLETIAIREKTLGKEHPDYAGSLNNLGNLYSSMGAYEKAEPLYFEAIIYLGKKLGKEHRDYASSLHNLGGLYFKMGAYEKVEPLLLEAKIIQEKILGKEHPDYALSLNNLGNLYKNIGIYEKAEPLYLDAVAIREKKLKKGHPDYAMSLNDLGLLYKIMGAYEKSESLYLEAQTICLKTMGKESPCYITSLINLGNLYSIMGIYEKAVQHHLEVKAIREKKSGMENPEYAASLNYLGLWYWSMGIYEKAEPLFLEAKAIEEKTLGRERPSYAASLINLSVLYDTQDRFTDSEPLLKDFVELRQSQLFRSVTFLSERELGAYSTTFQEDGNRLSSFLLARLAKNKPTDIMTFLCLDHSLFQKGFLLDAASRLNKLASSSPESAEIYLRLKGYRRRLAAEYAKPIAERDNVLELEERANALEKELVRNVPSYADAMRQVKWQEVKNILNADEVAIEFVHFQKIFHHLTDSALYAALLLLSGDTAPHFIPLCEQRQLDALIPERKGPMSNYLQTLYASPRADGHASLYQLLWDPLERIFREKGVKTVYYSPSGLLHRLNLAAIAPDKSGQTLADRYRLVPMGSTRQLVVGSGTGGVQIKDALVYGGIRYDMDSTAIVLNNITRGATAQDTTGGLFRYSDRSGTRGDKWEYLPGTEKEANHVHDLLTRQGVKSTRWRDYEATEELFKQIGQNGPSPSLLHIATHGFFFPDPATNAKSNTMRSEISEPVFKISEHPLIRSGLVLAGANYAWKEGRPLAGGHEDGILTAHEVSQMNLSNTELVVLSACETGLGDIKGNEGVYGLQRAFRIAGAKNVLMSLWKVPDEATEKLMTRFYQNWLEQKVPLRASFEAAQKWLRGQKGYENPYFWAGFVLNGE